MPSQKTVFVTGATGNQGGGVVRHSLRAGHKVFALVRDPASAAAKELSALGAELVHGNLDNVPVLTSSIANNSIDAVFHMQPRPNPPNAKVELQQTQNVVNAARAADKVKTLIISTVFGAERYKTFPHWGTPDFPLDPAYWEAKSGIEDIVRNAGFENWTIIRPVFFLQLLTPSGSRYVFPGFSREDRTLRVAFKPDTKIAWIDGADAGVAAAAVIANPEKYRGKGIDLAVEALTIAEIAEKLSNALGEEVKVHYFTDEEAKAAMKTHVIGGHFFGNQVPSAAAVEASREFASELTSVDDFFVKNKGVI